MKFDKIILLGAAILAASPLPLEGKSRKGKGDVTVAVFSLNDFHGGFVRNDYKNIPGAPAVWQTLDSLKSVYPYNVTVAAATISAVVSSMPPRRACCSLCSTTI